MLAWSRARRVGERATGPKDGGGGLPSAQREAARSAGLAIERGGRSDFFRGLFVGEFQLCQVSFHLIRCGPAQHVEAEHLVRALRRLATRPEGQHQAGDDRAVGLNLDAVLVVTQQVTAAQQMFELAEKDLDGPTVGIEKCDDFGGDIEQVRGNPQDAVAIDAG